MRDAMRFAAVVGVVCLLAGCSMCLSPHDYDGPVYFGDSSGGCGECGGFDSHGVNARMGSILSGGMTYGGMMDGYEPYYDEYDYAEEVPARQPTLAPQNNDDYLEDRIPQLDVMPEIDRLPDEDRFPIEPRSYIERPKLRR